MSEEGNTQTQIKQENLDESNRESGNFGPGRRGGRGGGSRFSGGPGRGGGNHNRGDRHEGNQHQDDFRGRGRRGNMMGRGGPRGGRGGRDGPFRDDQGPDGDSPFRGRGPIDKIADKLNSFHGSTYDVPPLDTSEKKFNGRTRIYVGNISNEVSEDDLVELFKPFGETAEVFVNKEKNFGFIKLDYRVNVEKAKQALDGTLLKGRNLKIRFAPNSATVKVKNLNPYVSNELLHYAFSPFGEIEKVHVYVDERGKPTGEGYIHFAKKYSAAAAIKKCQEGCLFITSSLQPVIVEPFEVIDDVDGFSDKAINKKNPEFHQEREQPPRLARPNSFEFEYGQKWKNLYELFQQKEEALKNEFQIEKEKLIAQMEYAKYEHETEMLRNQLRAREMDFERTKREWEHKGRMSDEHRNRSGDFIKREEGMGGPAHDDARRREESNLFMQAHSLDNLMNQQEQAFEKPNEYFTNEAAGGGGGGGSGEVEDPKQFMSSYERHNSRFSRDNRPNRGGHWVTDNRRDDYGNQKRRRF